MAQWYEVFDNSEVQWLTRKRAAKVTMAMALGGAGTLGGLALGQTLGLPLGLTLIALVLAWTGLLELLARYVEALRRVVWCLKLSDRHVAGYDYRRQKISFDWIRVVRIDLSPEGLVVVGPDDQEIIIPHLFPDYATLSHRILHYAEFYDIPLCIHGESFAEMDVYHLFPFLREAEDAAD